MNRSSLNPASDPRVNAAIQEYLDRLDRGETVDVAEFLARHESIAPELRAFIEASEDMARLIAVRGREPAEVSTSRIAGAGGRTVAPGGKDLSPDLPEQFGRYWIQRPLGRGAMGVVYLATDTQLNREVALKIPNFGDDASGEMLERFYREARSAATLRSPHICPVYDVGQIAGRHFISMAFIDGTSLASEIKSRGPLPPRHVLVLVRKLALALQQAHDQGIVHRDLKPGNVMLDGKREPVITDFGLACQIRDEGVRLTHQGTIIGSPAYMSPEQVEGDPTRITPATDQYSLGVIFYELLTGELPFQGRISAVLGQILSKPFPSPRQQRPDLDQRLETLCLQMTAKSPTDRLPTMTAVAEAIAEILKASAPTAISEKPPRASETNRAVKHDSGSSSADSLLMLARKLMRKRDYGEVLRVLSQIPSGRRSPEVTALLDDASEKDEECRLLLDDIGDIVREKRFEDLAVPLKRFLQLKPGHTEMNQLAADLKEYGPGEAIRIRRSRRRSFDPAGPTNIWKLLLFAGSGILALAATVYLAVILFTTPRGTVIIEVHDPRITVSFADQEITVRDSGKTFRLNTTDHQTLQVELDGVTIESSARDITVTKNETKRISARLVDGVPELSINEQPQTFAAPERQFPKPDRVPDPVAVAAPPGPEPVPQPDGGEWIDLLDPLDLGPITNSNNRLTRDGATVLATLRENVESGWVIFAPTHEITGDYDVDIEFRVVGSPYLQIALPLTDSSVNLALKHDGAGFNGIEGEKQNGVMLPPFGNLDADLRETFIHRVTGSVRLQGDRVSVIARMDGVEIARWADSRAARIAANGPSTRKNKLAFACQFLSRTPNHRLEVQRARVKLLPTSTVSGVNSAPWQLLAVGDQGQPWVASDSAWRIVKSVVDITPDRIVQASRLASKEEFADFELNFQYRLQSEGSLALAIHEAGATSIIPQVLLGFAAPKGALRSVQAGALHGGPTTLVDSPDIPRKELERALHKGEWIDVYVRSEGPRLSADFNRMPVIDHIDSENRWPRTGRIAFLASPENKVSAEIRNVQVRPLPPR